MNVLLTLIRKAPYLTVFLAAFAVRIVLLWGMSPTWESPGISYGFELGQIAANIADGRGFSSPLEVGSEPTAWFPPAVPLLWALIFTIFGIHSDASLLAIHGLQAAAGSLACAFYVRLVSDLWIGRRERGMVVLVAGCLLIFWPPLLLSLWRPWYTAFQDCGVALLLWKGREWTERPTTANGVRIGTVAAITALISPVPLVLLGWLYFASIYKTRAWIPATKSLLVTTALVVTILAPWAWRNYSVFGVAVWSRSGFGIEFQQGNGPEGTPRQTATSVHPKLRADEKQRYDELGEVTYSQQAAKNTLDYILASPLVTAKRTAQRVYLYWFDDLLDQWTWRPSPGWWTGGIRQIGTRTVIIGFKIAPVLMLMALLIHGAALRTPGAFIFAGVLLLLPLPYYLTHVTTYYADPVIPTLLLWNSCAAFTAMRWRDTSRGF